MNADYARFNLKPPLAGELYVLDPIADQLRQVENKLFTEHEEAVRKQLMEKLAIIREANKAVLSTPLLRALWAFFERDGTQDGTEVSFDGIFDLKELAAVIEETLE